MKTLAIAVLLLGTGFPRPDPNHAGAATAVIVGNHWFLVDAGRGATMRIAATQMKYEEMRAVFITHLHSDHIGGLPDLFATSWLFGRNEKPMELFGPAGIEKLASAMLQFYEADIHIRRDLTESKPAGGATFRVHVVKEGVVYKDDDVTVTAFLEDHRPVVPAFGYKFEAAGKTIVISGDTRPNANLVKYAKDADVLVQEAYLPEHFDKFDDREVAAKLKHYHTSAEEAGQIARDANVKKLVITHVIPAGEDETFRERIAKAYKGPVVIGKDLDRIDVK